MKKTLSTVAAFVLILSGIGVRAAFKYFREYRNSETTIGCHGVSFTIPGDWKPSSTSHAHGCAYQSGLGQAITVIQQGLPTIITPEEAGEVATQHDEDTVASLKRAAIRDGEALQVDAPINYECGSLHTVQRTMMYAPSGHLGAMYIMASPTEVVTIVVEADKMDGNAFKQLYLRVFEAARTANAASKLAPPDSQSQDAY